MRGLSRRAGVRFFRLFTRQLGPAGARVAPGELELRLVGERDAIALCGDPELDLSVNTVRAAYSRGDCCVAAFDAGRAVGYCWCGFSAVPHLDGVWVDFHAEAAWTYKSLVLRSHRGRGIAPLLYRFTETLAMERGRRFSVICVESHNHPSIAAARHAGYAAAGFAAYLRRGATLLTWSSPAARRSSVRFYIPTVSGT